MQTKFMMSDTTVQVVKLNEETALDQLPPKVYILKHDPYIGFYLDIAKNKLEIPKRIYGKAMERVNKCIRTYQQRTASTGILMTGDKGTGKTLLMSLLANAAITELNMPVILIKTAFHGTQFTSFIELLGECCLVFDEFGKMYTSNNRNNENEVSQKSLLSLMDGVDKTKRLLILTENSHLDISEFMLNRPSRIYYHFKYTKLDEDSIRGYCEDLSVRKEVIKDIIDLSRRSRIFSFDMLQSIVEEQLRFDCTVDEAVTELNIDIREDAGTTMEIIKVVEKTSKEEREVYGSKVVQKPGHYVYIKVKKNAAARNMEELSDEIAEIVDSENDKYDEFYLNDADLAYEHGGQLVYENRAFTVVAKEIYNTRSNYFHLLA